MTDSQVLIVGAGPTGLALALFLAKAGVSPRIIAKTAGPGLESRAMVVQARSLEFYRQLGFADDVVRKGIPINDIAIREDGHIVSKIDIDEFCAGISPYPFVLSFPHDDHEKLLVQQLEAAGGKVDQFIRETVFPHLMPFLLGFSGTRGAAFRLLSQVHLNYHGSALSEGEAGEVHGGDCLPWVPLEDAMDNFAPLTSFDWQVHVYGKATQALRERVSDAGLTLHTFDWIDQMKPAGLKQDALYLIRPDGYVALADASQDVEKLTVFLSKFKLRPAKAGPEARHKAIP